MNCDVNHDKKTGLLQYIIKYFYIYVFEDLILSLQWVKV